LQQLDALAHLARGQDAVRVWLQHSLPMEHIPAENGH
jgi:hypothetical protein